MNELFLDLKISSDVDEKERNTVIIKQKLKNMPLTEYNKTFSTNNGLKYLDITNTGSYSFPNNKVISLFSGAGGLDIGLEEAGFETVYCVEINSDCRETLRKNRPHWKLYEKDGGDIRSLEASQILKETGLVKGEAALVVGGAPCQPFSNIGKKNGKDCPQNGDLFLHFLRILKGIQPKAFIFENVRGITQEAHKQVLQVMHDQLKKLGYEITASVINAADYGVPQRRERYILIGIKGEIAPAFPLPTHCRNKVLWKQFIEKLDVQPDYVPSEWITLDKAFSLLSPSLLQRRDNLLMQCSDLVRKRMTYIGPGENFKVLPLRLRPDCWKNGKHQGQDTFGRLKLDEPSVTIRTAAYNPSKGKYIHPTEHRGLSTLELSAIQGFPVEWHFYCVGKPTLVSISRQIGNAVPPPLGRALGLSIKEQIICDG